MNDVHNVYWFSHAHIDITLRDAQTSLARNAEYLE